MRWTGGLIATVIAIIAFGWLSHGRGIPALVESDYCYLLTAADRLFDGHGPTAPVPVAPHQPWEWRTDWAFLTQWPVGYPVLIAVVRWVLDVSTMEAVRWLGVLACALTLVGWYVWVQRCAPGGVMGALLAAVATGLAVPFSALVDPSTDALLVAAVPYVLLLTERAFSNTARLPPRSEHTREVHLNGTPVPSSRALGVTWPGLAGVAVGSIFWIRYAGIFLLAGVGGYVLIQHLHGRFRRRDIVAFALGAALPIGALLTVNQAFGTAVSVQNQLNLGRTVSFQFSADLIWSLWWNFTNLGFYDHHWYSHWAFALFPFFVVLVSLPSDRMRAALGSYYRKPPVVLSVACVAAMLLMLAATSVLFGDKFNYASLDRYYAPVRPFYFVLFVVPGLLIPDGRVSASTWPPWVRRVDPTLVRCPPLVRRADRRSVRRADATDICGRFIRPMTTVALILGGHWIIEQNWIRPYRRWEVVRSEVTPYGQWARCFVPGAAVLYAWLREGESPDEPAAANLIVVSNYHEYIALETKIPALPIPPDRQTLDAWVERVSAARGIERARVLFVLGTDNRWRDYWIPSPTETIATFGLTQRVDAPAPISAAIFEYAGPPRGRRSKSERTIEKSEDLVPPASVFALRTSLAMATSQDSG